MEAAINKLSKITLGKIVFINAVVMITFMTINSLVCSDGLVGGACVKHLDNQVFLFQITVNVFFVLYYILKIDKRKWGVLILNLFLTTIIYVVAATIHSITKAGLI